MNTSKTLLISLVAASLLAGCEGTVSSEPLFISVDREALTAPQNLQGQVSGSNFYVAIAKAQLGERLFLSSYLKQFYPTVNDFDVPAVSLGTHVVKFEVQNGQVIVFDADNRKTADSSYTPTVILDAYPLVTDYAPFNNMPGHEKFVLFNPADGRNEFSVFGNMNTSMFTQEGVGIPLSVHTAFMQRFRTLADGVSFEKVFAGTKPNADGSIADWAGTLSMSIRRYVEGDGFKPVDGPNPMFFSSAPFVTSQSNGYTGERLAHWNIHPGMKPIRWTISREVLELQNNPAYAKYDLVGAMKRGVENWNSVFGYPVFVATLADRGEQRGDDEDNQILVDLDTSLGFAFADMRTNPNSGEIRGASVYFSSSWVEFAAALFDPAVSPDPLNRWGAKTPKPKTAREAAAIMKHRSARLGWGGTAGSRLCGMSLRDFARGARKASAAGSPERAVEDAITEVILHEVGHTLGLRHNFKGSILPNATQPTSSVMEYGANDVLGKIHTPGPYDIAALKYLYGMSPDLPKQPFCTDEGVFAADPFANDPLCMTFDKGSDPLRTDYGKLYTAGVNAVLATGDLFSNFPFFEAMETGNHLFAAESPQRAEAFRIMTEAIAPPIPAAKLATPGYADSVDQLRQMAYQFIFQLNCTQAADGTIACSPVTPFVEPAFEPVLLGQMKAILENGEGFGSIWTRTEMVSELKSLQSVSALTALTQARATISTKRATLTGQSLVEANEVIREIDDAINPYFTFP